MTSASMAMRGGAVSAEGAALQRFPATVPILRTSTLAMYLNRMSNGRIVLQDVGMGGDFGKPGGRAYGEAFFGIETNLVQPFNSRAAR